MKNPKILFLFFLFIGFALFVNALNHPFMIDDHAFFDEMSRNPKNLWLNFIPDKSRVLNLEGARTEVYYRPLALIVPKLVFCISGGNPLWMHLFNLFLFIVASWLLARFIFRLSGNLLFGILTALFMLAHPLNGIIVNFKTAGIFALQLICLIGVGEFIFKEKLSFKDRFLSVILFLSALFCHESSFALPVVLMTISIVVRREGWRVAWFRLMPLWLTTVGYFLLRMQWASLDENLFAKFSGYHMSVWEYLATWFSLQAWYIGKFIAPQGIVISVLKPVVRQDVLTWCILGISFWSGLLWVLLRFLRQRVWMLTGFIWFLVGMFMLAVGALFQGQELMIEPHWFVFTSVGLFVMLSDLIIFAIEGRLKLFVVLATALLFLSWSFWTWSYNALWNNERAYCRYWLEQNPSFKPIHLYIARSYFGERKFDLAAKHYFLALTHRYPDYLMYTNLGSIALLQNDLAKAKMYLEKALAIEPKARTALNSMAIVYIRQGNWNKAEDYFKKAVDANPYDTTALQNLNLLRRFKLHHSPEGAVPLLLR